MINSIRGSTVKFCRSLVISKLHFSSTVVPRFPQWHELKDDDVPRARKLTNKEVEQLESISLVQYQNTAIEKGRLEATIHFSASLQLVNTDNIEPMLHISEEEPLFMRQDVITDKGCAKSILKNAKVVEEGYFVAPPGNVTFYESKEDDICNNINSEHATM